MSKDKEDVTKIIADAFEKELRGSFIKNIIMGWETANQMILNYINDGHDIDEVKSFLENNLKPANKKNFEKIVNYGVVGLDDKKSSKKTKNKKG